MNPTEYSREWWKERLPFIQAFTEGKTVHVNMATRDAPHRFTPVAPTPDFRCDVSDYRIAPEPKLRPWKMEEVPMGAVVRYKCNQYSVRLLITASTVGYAVCGTANWKFHDLLDNMEHSTDGGKTWHPCGVMEEQV